MWFVVKSRTVISYQMPFKLYSNMIGAHFSRPFPAGV